MHNVVDTVPCQITTNVNRHGQCECGCKFEQPISMQMQIPTTNVNANAKPILVEANSNEV